MAKITVLYLITQRTLKYSMQNIIHQQETIFNKKGFTPSQFMVMWSRLNMAAPQHSLQDAMSIHTVTGCPLACKLPFMNQYPAWSVLISAIKVHQNMCCALTDAQFWPSGVCQSLTALTSSSYSSTPPGCFWYPRSLTVDSPTSHRRIRHTWTWCSMGMEWMKCCFRQTGAVGQPGLGSWMTETEEQFANPSPSQMQIRL